MTGPPDAMPRGLGLAGAHAPRLAGPAFGAVARWLHGDDAAPAPLRSGCMQRAGHTAGGPRRRSVGVRRPAQTAPRVVEAA